MGSATLPSVAQSPQSFPSEGKVAEGRMGSGWGPRPNPVCVWMDEVEENTQ